MPDELGAPATSERSNGIGEPISVELLRATFSYDARAGKFFRKATAGNRIAGSECGARKHDYFYLYYQRERILAHRAAWALFYGQWPDKPVDHVNCDRFDNRIANLRLATVAENNRNRPKQSNNTSGYKGVVFHKGTGKFEAKIMANKKRYSLGCFDDARDASIAYATAAKILHGEYARTTLGGSNDR